MYLSRPRRPVPRLVKGHQLGVVRRDVKVPARQPVARVGAVRVQVRQLLSRVGDLGKQGENGEVPVAVYGGVEEYDPVQDLLDLDRRARAEAVVNIRLLTVRVLTHSVGVLCTRTRRKDR